MAGVPRLNATPLSFDLHGLTNVSKQIMRNKYFQAQLVTVAEPKDWNSIPSCLERAAA
jgi:hypothetical protein